MEREQSGCVLRQRDRRACQMHRTIAHLSIRFIKARAGNMLVRTDEMIEQARRLTYAAGWSPPFLTHAARKALFEAPRTLLADLSRAGGRYP